MKNMLLIMLLCYFFLMDSYPVFSQDENHDAQYLSITREFSLNPDGSTDYRYIKKQKLLTYRSVNNLYGETFIVYNPEFQQLKINDVFTVMRDGKKIACPANARNEVLPGFAANAPAYNRFREMVITHTGLERGAIINLDYQIHSQKDFFPALMGNEILNEAEPVKELLIRIRIPADKILNYRILNHNDPVIQTVENGYRVYSWTFSDLPALSTEEFQSGNSERYSRLLFSSCNRWEDIISKLNQQEAFRFEINASMKKEMVKLQETNPDPLALVLKLQEKVINELRLYPVPFKNTGYRMRPAIETWNSNGGTPAEKMILLTALLRQAGLAADPVLVTRSFIRDDKEGNLSLVDDFAVKVELKEEGTVYLSVNSLNSQNLIQTWSGRIFTTITKDGKPVNARSDCPEFKVTVQGVLICSSDPKITGEISISLTGAANPFYGLVRDKNKIKNYLSGGISGSDLKEAKISNSNDESTFQSYTAEDNKPFRKDSLFSYFVIPYLNAGIESWGIHTLSSKRETALEVPALAIENYEFSLVLPGGLALFTPVGKVSISNKAGTFLFDLTLEKGKLTIKKAIRIKEKLIPPENYIDFKILMDNWNNPRYKEVIFKKTN